MYKLLYILLFFPLVLQAESLLEVSATKENRIFLKFDKYPAAATSTLSENKRQIIISVPDTDNKSQITSLTGKGNINQIDWVFKNNKLSIYINLSEQSGYTIAPIKSLNLMAIETFSWSKIDKQEDLYRNALLAYESGIADVALDDLSNSKYKNSFDMIAEIELANNNFTNAIDAAFNAFGKSDMPLHLAVLTSFAKRTKDTLKLNYFLQKMSEFTGLKNISLQKKHIDSLNSYFDASKDKFLSLEINNKNEKTAEEKIAEERFKNIFPEDSAAKADSSALSSLLFKDFYGFPWWTEYLLYGVLILSLSVVYMYLRWRNRQILALKEFSEKKRKIDERKEKASKYHVESEDLKSEIEKGLEVRKKTVEKTIPKENDSKEEIKKERNLENKTSFSAEVLQAQKAYSQFGENRSSQKNPETVSKATGKEEKATGRDSRAKKIEQIIEALRINNKPSQKPEVKDYSGLSAKMQLAIKISEEELKQKNLKLSQLDNLSEDELDKLAKELGTGKASIETKKNVQDIMSDEKAIKELAKKFNKKE